MGIPEGPEQDWVCVFAQAQHIFRESEDHILTLVEGLPFET